MTDRQIHFQAIGTKWNIQIHDTVSDTAWDELLDQLRARIDIFDKTYSRFRPDSWLTSLMKQPGSFAMPADGYQLFEFYQKLYEATNGRVTPLIGQTMVEAGYDTVYSFQKKTLHQPPRWEDAMSYTSDTLMLKHPVSLDFGAAGKGYLVDIAGELLEAAGITSYLINAGGDLRYRSEAQSSLEIGLENPLDATEAIGITTLSWGSLCASAGNKRKWQDMTHIINPATLQSPDHILATWVTAEDTMTADGLATALFFTEPATLHEQFNFGYAVLHADMSLESSENFEVNVFEATS